MKMFNSRMKSSHNLKRRVHEGDGSTRPAKSLRQTVQNYLVILPINQIVNRKINQLHSRLVDVLLL